MGKVFTVRLPPNLRTLVSKTAESKGLTPSEFTRTALIEKIDKIKVDRLFGGDGL